MFLIAKTYEIAGIFAVYDLFVQPLLGDKCSLFDRSTVVKNDVKYVRYYSFYNTDVL